MDGSRHYGGVGPKNIPRAAPGGVSPLRAFASWFLHSTCDCCGKDRMPVNETQTPRGNMLISEILERHDGCGGRVAKAELLTPPWPATASPATRPDFTDPPI